MPVPFAGQGDSRVPLDLRRAVWDLITRYRSEDNTWRADEYGYKSWSFDPHLIGASSAATAGLLYLSRLHVSAGRLSHVHLYVASAGVTLTAGQNFAAIYTAAGALIGVTEDQTTPWESTGFKNCALADAYDHPGGDLYVGYWANGGTPPSFGRNSQTGGAVNGRLAAPNLRFATADSGLTTTAPASLGTQTGSGTIGWAALS